MNMKDDQMDADRIALRKMFKAIADYGRQVRLRRQGSVVSPVPELPAEPAREQGNSPIRRRKPRRRKVTPGK